MCPQACARAPRLPSACCPLLPSPPKLSGGRSDSCPSAASVLPGARGPRPRRLRPTAGFELTSESAIFGKYACRRLRPTAAFKFAKGPAPTAAGSEIDQGPASAGSLATDFDLWTNLDRPPRFDRRPMQVPLRRGLDRGPTAGGGAARGRSAPALPKASSAGVGGAAWGECGASWAVYGASGGDGGASGLGGDCGGAGRRGRSLGPPRVDLAVTSART
jgi:hypothetical protein